MKKYHGWIIKCTKIKDGYICGTYRLTQKNCLRDWRRKNEPTKSGTLPNYTAVKIRFVEV